MFPVMASADESNALNASFNNESSFNMATVDSIPKIKRQDDKDAKKKDQKDKDAKRRDGADIEKEPKAEPKTVDIDPKRPNIREVPKARPKLRPGAVTDKVKIKRPPVRVKPGRVLRIGL